MDAMTAAKEVLTEKEGRPPDLHPREDDAADPSPWKTVWARLDSRN